MIHTVYVYKVILPSQGEHLIEIHMVSIVTLILLTVVLYVIPVCPLDMFN